MLDRPNWHRPDSRRRVAYIQYTNPAGYPPLEHSSRILADAGWRVLFLGTGAFGSDALVFPPHPNIAVRRIPFCPGGWRQKLHYGRFLLWNLLWAVRFRPSWIYASDPLSTPIALAAARLSRARVLYHEHDSPAPVVEGVVGRLVARARGTLARQAAICVLPNERRLARFLAATGRRGPTYCVWNCPELREVAEPRRDALDGLTLLYHGSLTPDRLPLTVLDALALLPTRTRLRVVGYETVGAQGYVASIRARAARLGIPDRVTVVGALPARADLLGHARQCDVGLALMPLESDDPNCVDMVGASNKPFDYLAGGLALLVSDLPDWRRTYVEAGYGLACDPGDPRSIAEALTWLIEHPPEVRAMGEAGRQRIKTDWNYEQTFKPVLDVLGSGCRQRSGAA
jgi:glycosyltransferase involved in cell wall biosynthesis